MPGRDPVRGVERAVRGEAQVPRPGRPSGPGPIWSSSSTAYPARRAAVASTWLTVTIPVPPTPVRKTDWVPAGTLHVGSGTLGGVGRAALARFGLRVDLHRHERRTVPSRQE